MTFAEIFGQVLLGWLIADLLSGVVHWWEDRLARQDWPLIGPLVIAPNRLHHREPLAFLRSGPLTRNLAVWIVVAAIAAAWMALFGPGWMLASALIGGLLVNEVHGWAHQPASAPGWVRILQDTGLFQSPPHHAGHHRAASDRRYCILTNWLNPVLDALGVWTRLEGLLARLRLEPNRGTA